MITRVCLKACPACGLRPRSAGWDPHVYGAVLSPVHFLPPAGAREGHAGGTGEQRDARTRTHHRGL